MKALMRPQRSELSARFGKLNQNKRDDQVGLIKTIQQICKTKQPEGDWLHTPGPGRIATNYFINEQAFNPNTTYFVVEYFKDVYQHISRETFYLKKKLKKHPWYNPIKTKQGEIFGVAERQIKKGRKILFVNADLCKTPRNLCKQGIIDGIKMVCEAQARIEKNFFMALTYSTRNSTDDDYWALEEIDKTIESFNGEPVYYNSYSDGTRMATIMWYFKNKAA